MSEDKEKLPLRKLSLRRLATYFGDLFLLLDQSEEWVRDGRVRRLWHIEFFSILIFLFIRYIGFISLEGLLLRSAWATEIWRLFWILAWIWMLALNVCSAFAFYRYLLLTGKDLRLSPIVVFWLTWVVFFAMLYHDLYFLGPGFYSYANAPVVPAKTLSNLGYANGGMMYLQFLIYSACTTFTIGTPGLSSSSLLVTSLNLVEVVGNFLLMALLVSTFVNKSAAGRK